MCDFIYERPLMQKFAYENNFFECLIFANFLCLEQQVYLQKFCKLYIFISIFITSIAKLNNDDSEKKKLFRSLLLWKQKQTWA